MATLNPFERRSIITYQLRTQQKLKDCHSWTASSRSRSVIATLMPVRRANLPLSLTFTRRHLLRRASIVTGRRKALVPYVFQDGSRLEKGDWVCVPQKAMMHDGARYHDPDTFDGFRFAKANDILRLGQRSIDVPDVVESRLTDAKIDWPIWGFGNTAW